MCRILEGVVGERNFPGPSGAGLMCDVYISAITPRPRGGGNRPVPRQCMGAQGDPPTHTAGALPGRPPAPNYVSVELNRPIRGSDAPLGARHHPQIPRLGLAQPPSAAAPVRPPARTKLPQAASAARPDGPTGPSVRRRVVRKGSWLMQSLDRGRSRGNRGVGPLCGRPLRDSKQGTVSWPQVAVAAAR